MGTDDKSSFVSLRHLHCQHPIPNLISISIRIQHLKFQGLFVKQQYTKSFIMPGTENLPKVEANLKEEIEKPSELKHVEVAEKIVLPSAEDLKNEKVHENLQKGIEGFTPDKLKAVKTKEPASGADLMKTEIATGATIKAVEGFDAAALKKAKTVEKNSLPDQEAIKAEKEHEQFKTNIEGFDKDKLKDVQTIEKNTLPTKETIEQEKTA